MELNHLFCALDVNPYSMLGNVLELFPKHFLGEFEVATNMFTHTNCFSKATKSIIVENHKIP